MKGWIEEQDTHRGERPPSLIELYQAAGVAEGEQSRRVLNESIALRSSFEPLGPINLSGWSWMNAPIVGRSAYQKRLRLIKS